MHKKYSFLLTLISYIDWLNTLKLEASVEASVKDWIWW